ncbi:MAG: Hsp20/alpha crystallin family protein [Promethearchaeota archaeon]
MNENSDFKPSEEEDIELEEETAKVEKALEMQKKQEELSSKKKQSFHLLQSKDSPSIDSSWGTFKIRPSASLDIEESEPFYRTPLVNIIESEETYHLFIELPGLDKRNVKISLQEGILEILGEKGVEHKEKKEDKKDKDKKDKEKKEKDKDKKDKKKDKEKEMKGEYIRREFRSASFYRSFYLPEEIDLENIDASFKNGILRLKIPKKTIDSSEKRVIEIK